MLKIVLEPQFEPLTLAEVKLHCRVIGSDDDTLLASLIVAARQRAEHELERSLMLQTWSQVIDSFEEGDIRLGMPPVIDVDSVEYVDTAGVLQPLATDQWSFLSSPNPGFVVPAYGAAWPATLDVAEAVTVTFRAGYSSSPTEATQQAAVPKAIKQWMLLQIGALYENREAIAAGVSVAELPGRLVDGLLDRYRLLSV